ncbi:hypothetical protein N800_11400 [Lysobacter daejeonensis GH1-9]|uniref:Uncharacterized protein n=1 Tax=Lysobacter daejeonensis GH1-9 TaxID=1385517 RepID=A0A0A0ENP2_9GAMM|nr:hypothetical protein [Lysobacter daejeonensis]KGM52616.1 hypothetical protein N800_11400 [Lysobacter daejeonensis GH1-9]
MNDGRRFAGWLCVALGFAVVVLLGYGVIDPIGLSTTDAPDSLAAVLYGLLPTVLGALALFVLGLWLLKGGRRDKR